MSTADEYRGYATDCLRLAQEATTPADKARFLQMAQAWRELADKADKPRDSKTE
jgi:hypothetical protein